MLLFLVIYIFAILGCLLFGANDPVHFGDVSIAMMTLFQVCIYI
jgi:voltage-gated sodium channel